MEIPVDPGWLSLLPPILAIVLALIFREVLLSLFAGIWLGGLLLHDWNPFTATLRGIDEFALSTLANDAEHAATARRTLRLRGMVGAMRRSVDTRGIVAALRPPVTSARRGRFFAWLSGIIVFFHDYANSLNDANTMRPVADLLRISREK